VLARRRPHLTPREIGVLGGSVLAGVLLLGGLTAANASWSALLPGGGGFYSIWAASREFLFGHGDPYGLAAAALAQNLAYGGAADSLQNPYRLDLPFFLLPLYLPFGLIADPDVARGAWATVSQLAIIGAVFICMRLVDWRPPRASLLVVCLVALINYPVLAALVEGTLVAILLLVYVAILWAMQTENDELAGSLAVLTLCKWEVGLPFLLVLALRTIAEKRWRIVAGFGMTLTILLLVAFLVFPGWFMPFVVATVAMMRSLHGLSLYTAMLELWPEAASKAAPAMAVVVLVLLMVEILGARGSGLRRFSWTTCLVMAATPLLGLRGEVTSLVMLIPGLVMIAAGGSQRRPHGALIAWCLLGLLLAGPWLVMSALVAAPLEWSEAVIFAFLPVASVVGMYWTRWWFLRPPRTWLDDVRASR
jgi:hypothetical protein